MDLYPWVVLTHVLAAFAFALSHGVSAYAGFAMRANSRGIGGRADAAWPLRPERRGLYISLLVLLVAGIAAAIMGGWFGRAGPGLRSSSSS